MGLVNFPTGISSFGVPQLGNGSLIPETTGKVVFVDSNATNAAAGNFGSVDDPFATINQAINFLDGEAADNKGPVIVVMPNHAETITAASAITADVDGLTIVGLGSYNQRPRILLDTATTVDVAVSGADVTFRNLVFASGHADIVRCFAITGKGCWLDMIEFADNTTAENFLTPIKATSTTNNNADGLKVTNCRWVSPDAGCLEFIEANADVADMIVQNNFVVVEGTASPLVLFATGKDAQRCDIRYNFISHKMTANELLVNIDTSANSGIIAHNRVGHADVTTSHDLGIDGLGCRLFDNLSTSTDSLSGVILPAADVDS